MLKLVFMAAAVTSLVAAHASPVQAQRERSGEAEVQRLIDQLQPSAATRGIRLPSETPRPPSEPAATDRVAVPAVRPAAVPPPRTPAATAPAALPAASLTVLFASASAGLTPQAEEQLNVLGRALTSSELASYRFKIEGHTDSVGSRESNQLLSERRAAAVRDFLIARFGMDGSRLEAVGMGEDQPLVPRPDETPEQRNRRVRIVNLGG
jgi:outer membrane protein OmpA-like peptidoglycan-associated protein